MARGSVGIKGQDVLLLAKLIVVQHAEGIELIRRREDSVQKTYRDLSWELAMSTSEVHAAERRLIDARLLSQRRRVLRAAAKEFLLHGFKYVFPARPGEESLGIPTGRAAPPLRKSKTLIVDSEQDLDLVWPWADGTVRGRSIQPIYDSVPQAAQRDAGLYEWLALLDCLRVGKARDRNYAAHRITKRLTDVGSRGK